MDHIIFQLTGMARIRILILIGCICSVTLQAQNKVTDSLERILPAIDNVEEKISVLNDLTVQYLYTDLAKARKTSVESSRLASGLQDKDFVALTPVLFLTALDDVRDRVRGLNLGGDDYLVKPFDKERFHTAVERAKGLIEEGKAQRFGKQISSLLSFLKPESKRADRLVVKSNGRILFMFCAFTGAPRIIRLHGRGTVVLPGTPSWDALYGHFSPHPSARAIIRVDVTRISESCGWGVPLFEFKESRSSLTRWAETKGPEGLKDYQGRKNRRSIDGLPALDS